MANLRTAYFLAVSMFAAEAMYGQASQPASDAAPIPPAITSAKKVFISNAGTDNPLGKPFFTNPNYSYDEFYHSVKALNRYELLSAPADADIILEISVTTSPEHRGGYKDSEAVVRLRMLDPKTQTTLWAFYERVERPVFVEKLDKNLDKAIKRIVSDLSSIAGTPNSSTP